MSKTKKLLIDYGVALMAPALTAGICYAISSAIGYQTVGLIFLIVVAGLSLFLGRTALIFAAVLSFAVWNFLFIPPLYTFRVHHLHDLIALVANLVVAIVGSTFISRIRKSQRSLRRNRERLELLYRFLESLNNATSIKDVVRRTEEFLRKQFDAGILIYLKEKESTSLSSIPFGNRELHSDQVFAEAFALFAEDQPGPAAHSSGVASGMTFFPLIEPRKKLGVLCAILPGELRRDTERSALLVSCIRQVASSLEREISIDQAKEKEIFAESEKLFNTILNSVSHELKTPVAIISTALSSLADEQNAANAWIRTQIIRELKLASDRMTHLVENILEMSRIESGKFRLNLTCVDVADVIGSLVRRLKTELREHPVELQIHDNLPLVRADVGLLTQALTNVVRNSIVHTPVGSGIRIDTGQVEPDCVSIRILDEGPGVPEYALPRLAEKFYRVPGTKPGGTGLGLTIVKAIVEMHEGSLSLENHPRSGFQVVITLPTNPERLHGAEHV